MNIQANNNQMNPSIPFQNQSQYQTKPNMMPYQHFNQPFQTNMNPSGQFQINQTYPDYHNQAPPIFQPNPYKTFQNNVGPIQNQAPLSQAHPRYQGNMFPNFQQPPPGIMA